MLTAAEFSAVSRIAISASEGSLAKTGPASPADPSSLFSFRIQYVIVETGSWCSPHQSLQVWPLEREYSRAVTPQIRQAGNRLSGLAETAYASLLA